MKKLFCHVDYKDELIKGKRYIITPLMKGVSQVYVINEKDWHECYDFNWFKDYPPQICQCTEYFDSPNVDGELISKIKNKDEILKFL